MSIIPDPADENEKNNWRRLRGDPDWTGRLVRGFGRGLSTNRAALTVLERIR